MQTGEDYFKDTTDDFSSGGGYSSSSKLSNENRAENIEKIFLNVFGRKPSSRELAYYKYSPIKDNEIEKFLKEKKLNLRATLDYEDAFKGASYVIISTPTNYDDVTNRFDTSSVEDIIIQITAIK